MNDLTLLDRLRLREQGLLSRADAEALERELAADPALRALAQDFALAWSATAADPWMLARSRTGLDELESRLRGRLALRRAAAAAAVLVVAAGAFAAGRFSAPAPDAPLYLSAIELDAPLAPSTTPADLPADWAEYDPRGAGAVRFLTDLPEAEQLARAAHRPLLVYGAYPDCPLAAALDAKVFSSEQVMELVERTVPVRLDMAKLSEAEQRSLVARGYPFLEMWRDDGRTTHSLARTPDPAIFVESLHDGLAKSDATGEQPPWEEVRSAARRFVDARSAEITGRMAEAERGFRELLRDPRSSAQITAPATDGLRRLAQNARELLLAARAAAAHDPQAARRLLERALEAFAGTSFEGDLRAALERLVRDGRFPPLAEMDRST